MVLPGAKSWRSRNTADRSCAFVAAGDEGVHAGRLHHHHLGRDAAAVGQRQVLGPGAEDHRLAVGAGRAGRRGRRVPSFSSTRAAPPSRRSVPGRKFMAGEPMKPATNWLAGRS